MSYFLVGKLQFEHSLSSDKRIDIAFDVSQAALQNRIAIQLGCNIVQPTAFKIIGSDLSAKSDFTFLLTGSPISDVSDELIDYWADSGIEMRDMVRMHGEKIAAFFKSLTLIGPLDRIILFVSEGYDTSYREEVVSLFDLPKRLVGLASESDWFGYPSVKLIIPLNNLR